MAPTPQVIRPAAVAGSFYPDDPQLLRDRLDAFLSESRSPAVTPAPKALIVPHAGYIYSGPIAGTAYATLLGHPELRRVVLLGPAHRAFVTGLVHPGADALATPLGTVTVDTEALAGVPEVAPSPRAHAQEHCLEVQLPFLQRVLPGACVVPLLVGDASPTQVGHVLERLWGGRETLVVVSSDLSHYLPYERARRADHATAAEVIDLAHPHLLSPEQACGAAAINGLLWLATHKPLRARLLDLRSSGDTAGDRQRVVGYGAFAFDEVTHVARS